MTGTFPAGDVPVVRSYVRDGWITPEADDTAVTVLDPSTGEPVATVAPSGIDMAAVVAHARDVGGPALRAMTFRERGRLLTDLAAYLGERTAVLHQAHAAAGATLPDAKVDVEGGISVLTFYGRRAAKDLPDATVYVDDALQRLSRGGTFMGQTVYTSKPGVAVFINAFNFPVWGTLEKLAPALLAGLPVIVKPATPTAHIAEIAFAQMIESGILPAGTAQFIAGSAGDLLDQLDGRDYIAFTGSARTASIMRSCPAAAERSTLVNIEADSVNAAILGPDGVPGSVEFDQYIRTVVREMTGKTGQKCTAVRRCVVPAELVEPVREGLSAKLSAVVIGDPRDTATRMGPLVSSEQRDEVAGAVRRLAKSADVVLGGADETPSVGSGDVVNGAFFPPTLLVARDPHDPDPHRIEAFGPVSTIFSYTDAADAVSITALGEGSLVASVVSSDAAFVAAVTTGIAPFHGRVVVVDSYDAGEATPHGAVLPSLIHGGPGRAGGGEEQAGIRGVLRLMHATSLAASPTALTAVTERWSVGAAEIDPGVHPFRKTYDELAIGDTLHTASRTVTLEDIERFAAFTGDTFYAHMDEAAAAANPIFGGRVAHGYLVLSFAAGLFVDPAPGPVLANFGLERLRFVKPVYPGDSIAVRLTCKSKTPREPEYGEVRWDVGVTNQNGDLVASYELLTLNAYAAA
jgi:oxepin-CoA hydrolase/3-oxo-5,6-dehydrosuberyl-CoA semialdehyde dehydrogenase